LIDGLVLSESTEPSSRVKHLHPFENDESILPEKSWNDHGDRLEVVEVS
jgi:hypothetical protein